MRIVFMGSPQFAVPSLQRLLESRHEVVAVVTRPDKPKGRGMALSPTPVKELALAHNLPVLEPVKIKGTSFHEELAQFTPDIAVVVAYGHILPQAVLDAPRLGCINIHGSILPKYRGAAPVQWALINGERETGVTIMKLDAGMDTGDMLAESRVEILEDDDAQSLADMLSMMGADLLLKVLDEIEAKDAVAGTPQNHELATYAPMLKKEHGQLDFSWPIERLICRLRGVTPWPGAYAHIGEQVMRIIQMEPLPMEELPAEAQSLQNANFGTVVGILKGLGVAVRAGDGFVLLTQVQPSGKKPMGAYDAANGGYLKVGQRLT